ncbi:hypothetical protein GCM10020358_02460 [Amorphoplanes nipponensis]|uniref:Uncharacterized protein n=1 Tax=Actinoplanes nipponensis TaxID=135950 RepID=A0A919ML48_9ACTN|nr:hypothetical protein [Actinoplanes nipponensis]GIE48397.1 hypothetical protein Ani05nite_19310 [Actinoplanes nipponensis]
MSRRAYAHDAVLMMGPEADPRAPGGAITTALCGHWQHEPPCPLAEHHTSAERTDGEVRLHVLFATAPERETEVRELIDEALAAGAFAGPDGTSSFWSLVSSGPGTIAPEERAHAARLAG